MRRGRPRVFGVRAGIVNRQAVVFSEGLEFPGQEGRATGMALDLAAGGPGNRTAAHQHDRIQGQPLIIEYGLVNRIQHRRQILLPVTNRLLHQNQALAAVIVRDESGTVAGFQQRVAAAGGGLDILRITVQTAMIIRSSSRPVT